MSTKDKEVGAQEFEELLSACTELAESFPEGVIFIGGIAVYLHCINREQTCEYAEFTHDADFYISLADMADLRDIEEVTPNRRLQKHQLIKRGFEFDIYTERHSSLIVPYDQVLAHSHVYGNLRVACLEHLLVLKLEAYRDRHSSAKGRKDAKDVIRIGLAGENAGLNIRKLGTLNPELCVGYLSEEHLRHLSDIAKGPEFMSLARGNAKLAKGLRDRFAKVTRSIMG